MTPRKRARSSSPSTVEAMSSEPLDLALPESSQRSKKLKLHSSFTATSPFPDFTHPTPQEAREVHRLLSGAHPTYDSGRKMPINVSEPTGTRVESNVIEGLISTILSQNTSAQNSARAKSSLDGAFGRNNFAAIAAAPRAEVVDAIRQGGLANKKAATIQNILKSVKETHGEFSLQHLAATESGKKISDDEIMKELISYDGVGPKTASCVLLFSLGRDSFAVDTHVFRLSKMLGWVPARADRILTQAHLDLRIPDDLKYDLHVLMVHHGRICKGCKKAGSGINCILKTHVKGRKSQEEEEKQFGLTEEME